MRYKILAVDIDGTLTEDRSTTNICIEVIEKLRKIENLGIKTVLVSSNALPIVVGLSKYLGLSGLAIGETGALIYLGKNNIVHLTKYTARKALNDVINIFKDYVISSWQNMFRLYDFALKIRNEYSNVSYKIYREIKDYVERKYNYLRTGFSGYAIHLTPKDVSKGRALRYIMEKLGIEQDNSVCIGDSDMDIDFIKECGLGVAVSNADKKLKEYANYIASKPSCYGVIEVIDMITS